MAGSRQPPFEETKGDGLQDICRNHERALEIFCNKCELSICLHCLFEKHKDHDCILIEKIYQARCQELEPRLEQYVNLAKDKLTTLKNLCLNITEKERDIVEQSDKVKKEISEMEEEIIKAVRESARQLTNKVDTASDRKKQILANQRESAERYSTSLKDCIENVELSMKKMNPYELLKSQTMERIKKAVTEPIDIDGPNEKADIQLIRKDNKVMKAIHHMGNIGFQSLTNLQQFKVKDIVQVKRPLPKEQMVSFQLSIEHDPDSSLLIVPVSSINCSLIPVGHSSKDHKPISATATLTTYSGVYNMHCSPSTSGRHQVNVQVDSVQLKSASVIIPFNPYLDTVTPVYTIGDLEGPYGVAVNNDGFVIVTENGGDSVAVLDKEGKKIKSFGRTGNCGNTNFNSPRGVAITHDNHILITDEHRIQKLTMDGQYIDAVGEKGSGELKFDSPSCITISYITGYIYIADRQNNRIQALTPDLKFYRSFGEYGSNEGQLKGPYDIAIDKKGLLYVADWGNHRIQVFTSEGQYVNQFGRQGSDPGQLEYPAGITLDRSTNLVYIAEEYNHRVSVFTIEGQFVKKYGGRGTGEGQFESPREITFDKEGVQYICDFENKRLVVY